MTQFADKRYIYLAGKIDDDKEAIPYRTKVAPIFKQHGFYVLDPLRGNYINKTDTTRSNDEKVVRDLQDIERCSIVLALMMTGTKPSIGTPCEIMYAWERGKPVILITDSTYIANHMWIDMLCTHIFLLHSNTTFDEVIGKVVEHICHWYGESTENEIYSLNSINAKAYVQLPLLHTIDCPCAECEEHRQVSE